MALAKLGRYNDRMVVLDGDTKNSTFSELFKNEHPNRYMECYIAEQNMVKTVWHNAVTHFSRNLASFLHLCLCFYLPAGERGRRLRRAGP